MLRVVENLAVNQNHSRLLPRDAYAQRRLCRGKMSVSVRPSVCLSHAGILSKRVNISSKFFSPSGRQTILVFPYLTGWQYTDGDPLTGASNTRGMKKLRFSTNISLYIGNDAIEPQFLFQFREMSRACVSFYSSSILTVVISEIKRDIGQKSRFFLPLLASNLAVKQLRIFSCSFFSRPSQIRGL